MARHQGVAALRVSVCKTRRVRMLEEPLRFLGYYVVRNCRQDLGRECLGSGSNALIVASFCCQMSK